ncbi:tetratricopeptide repeat protein [Streptomyces gilvus]|uniref:tetratricopeptide repeat protein n=1 Tax=Streptomyces gilvus TaxID=2920937 RepID=UPI001F0D6632|nr:tetratricopeptide repeat protein [Streptomyces sp. CME 23]MCH5671754.1 tetratricopeptide repeat protein [Streptomyces sp. CME 23]
METQEEGRRPGAGRRMLIAVVAGCAVLGGGLALWPWERPDAHRPVAPAPGAQALTAVTTGVPAGLPELAALIGGRQARVRARPADAVSWAVLGSAYVERGRRTADAADYPRAEQALETSLRVRPSGNAEALAGMAALANARHDFPSARMWGEAALRPAPKRWTTYPLLIDAYTGLGDHNAAKRTLDRLLELRTGPAVQARAAAVYRDRGWREDAAAALTDAAAAARSPAERAQWLERTGQLAFERGDLQDALRHFQEAVRVDPDQRAAQAGQGRTLAAMGRTTEALSAYQVALEKQPCPQYALELGELYESLGLGQAARAEYDQVRALVRRDRSGGVDDELVLGVMETDHGDPATAVRRLRAEYARQPGIAVADALGWALHRTGDDKEALRYATVATDKAHGGGVRSALYAYHRGMIERALGQNGSARLDLTEALRINPYFSPLDVPVARSALAALGEPPDEPVPTARATPQS